MLTGKKQGLLCEVPLTALYHHAASLSRIGIGLPHLNTAHNGAGLGWAQLYTNPRIPRYGRYTGALV